MNRVIGIISSNYRSEFLQGITQDRPMAAIPFGGRYRLLDFSLSSMVNSGIRTVGIITPYLYRPILDHLGAGKEWYLDRKSGGLFILPGSTHGIYSRNNKFALKDLNNNMEFLTRDNADYVIISGSSYIYNLDFNPILESHVDSQADITIVYKELFLDADEEDQGIILSTDLHNRVSLLSEAKGQRNKRAKYFTDIIILRRKLLLDIIKGHKYIEYMDLIDVVGENLTGLKIQAYPLKGYFGRIYSMKSYYQQNINMLEPSVRDELFMGINRIHTKIKDNPATKYGSNSVIKDALVSSGCMIDGNISRSIIFRDVLIESDACVSNSIIMECCHIGKGAVLENVVLDKYVKLNSNSVIKGKEGYPVFIDKYAEI